MVDVCFSHVLDEENLTQAQEKCLDLDTPAADIIYRSLDDSIFGEIMNMKTAHEIWSYLNEKYGMVSNDDEPKEEAHECVEHNHDLGQRNLSARGSPNKGRPSLVSPRVD